jgi:cell division protein FtsW
VSAVLDRLREYISPDKSFVCLVVVFCPVAITLIGLVALSSASLSFYRSESLLHKQLTWFSISIAFFSVGLLLDLDFVRRWAGKALLALLALLMLALIPGIGHSVNGSRHWISAMGVSMQISEFTNVALILWLADYIDSIGQGIESFSEAFFKPFAVAACASGLILLEPDDGTAVLLGGIALSLPFLYGSRVSYVARAVAIAVDLMSV